MKLSNIAALLFSILFYCNQVYAQTSYIQQHKDNIIIHKMDTRSAKIPLSAVQDSAFRLSKKYLVVIVEVDKNDIAYQKKIEDAVVKNIISSRENIFLIYMDKIKDGHSKMFMIGKGEVSMPIVKGTGYNEADFIERVYKECKY